MRILSIAALCLSISGCALYEPVPEGYVGPTAVLEDTANQLSFAKSVFFVALKIDGRHVRHSIDSSFARSRGNFGGMVAYSESRKIPIKKITLSLRATHMSINPFAAAVSSGPNYCIDGDLEFQPAPEAIYRVFGELEDGKLALWIEERGSRKIVTQVKAVTMCPYS